MTDTLHAEPEKDQFRSESPIRAFTDWQVNGNYALGKGFRPSLQHVVAYLDAMQAKEDWSLVQVLEAGSQTPSFLFRKVERVVAKGPALAAPYGNDPINPKHYNGRACADIGERLSANGYQILKYCWRLGKKDDPCQELGKALWYAESETAFLKKHPFGDYVHPNLTGIKPDRVADFMEDRIADVSDMTKVIARILWSGYNLKRLDRIKEIISAEITVMECGRGLAI